MKSCFIIPVIIVGLLLAFFFYKVAFLPLGRFFSNKYRIVEREDRLTDRYSVQVKCFGIWVDESYFTGSIDYDGPGDFDDIESAKKYIKRKRSKNLKIIHTDL